MGKKGAGRKPVQKKVPLGWIVGGVVIVVLLLIGLSWYSNRPKGAIGTGADTAAGRKVKGPETASVKVVEYADFQCPTCGVVHKVVEPEIQKLVDAGQVQYTYKHFIVVDQNVGGSESQLSAEASECAADQGKFWAYHDFLFEHQRGEGKGTFAAARLKQFAADMSLDQTQFNQCLDSRKHKSAVQKESQEAEAKNLKGTPSFIINGKVLQWKNLDDVIKAIKGAVM